MLDEDNTNVSEWNEQMLYSRLYFSLMAKSHYANEIENYRLWKIMVLRKIVHIFPICSEDERNKLIKSRSIINTVYTKYENVINTKYKTMRDKNIAMTEMYNTIFDIETSIDTVANSHMPFLRLKEELSEEDL